MTPDQFTIVSRTLEAISGYLAVKNCGTGPHGFQAGNTCARGSSGNSLAGSERRREAGKRRRKGPDNGRSHAARRKHRKQAGHENAARRKWQARIEAGKGTAADKVLLRTQQKERRTLAKDIREGRHTDLKDASKGRKEVARSIRKERATERRRQAGERASQKQREAKESSKLERTQDRESERLKAKHEAQLAKASDPDALKATHAKEQAALARTHKEEANTLRQDHRSERQAIRDDQRESNRTLRQQAMDEAVSHRIEALEVRGSENRGHLAAAAELRDTQRQERLANLLDQRTPATKAYSVIAVKATRGSEEATAQSILDAALESTGHKDAWEAGSLTNDERLELLEAVAKSGEAWFRSAAEALLEDVGINGEKALFGSVKSKVSQFFARAKVHIRELFVAGVLAVTGPGPANPQEAIVQATQQQVQEQIEYLDKFKNQIMTEERPLSQQFAARAEMYGSSVWTGALEVERQGIIATAKASEVLRVLGPNESHCDECPPLAELGWVPMEDAERLGVAPLGRTTCLVRCRCYLKYR